MRYTTTAATLLSLATTFAHPSPAADPLRILPPNWSFTISSIRGPGCPDSGKNGTFSRITRPTFGSNTVDGTEIYYWYIAYPWMRVDLEAGPRHTWCETTLAYKEYKDVEKTAEAEDYKLRLHKNGTKGIMTYELDEGVQVYWDFAYYVGEGSGRTEVADTIALTGPASSGPYAQEHYSNISYPPELIPQANCGSGTFTFRTEMWVQGKEGQKGVVDSEQLEDQYYGAQQGFSYDWEKCTQEMHDES